MRMTTERASAVGPLLEELAGFGREGSGGVTRLLYTAEWTAAQNYLRDRMETYKLEPRFDRVGNLIGRLRGAGPSGRTILTGSHIDTVRSGGKYDGAYGVAAAMIAAQFLKETYGEPRKTIEIVSFCEEEGSRFPLAYWGSGSMTGVHAPDCAAGVRDADGLTLAQAMKAAGFGGNDLASARREDIDMFLEIHIEQGILLERSAERIGIVEAIAGQRRYAVTVAGEANHAGTTPMGMRRDAMAAAAEMMSLLESKARKTGDPLVATVGQVRALPNISNVIPGAVEFTLDIRHADEALLSGFCEETLAAFRSIAGRRDVEIGIKPVMQSPPAAMDTALTSKLERLCREHCLPYRRMMSGAGHDAHVFAGFCPTAMLFVPSRGGVSHSPDEFTKPEDLELGVRLLAEALYELAYEEK